MDYQKGEVHKGPQSLGFQAQDQGFPKAGQRDRYVSGHI